MHNARYGLTSLQSQIYGTSCQGDCILKLNPNDFIEVWTKQNSGSTQDIGTELQIYQIQIEYKLVN